MAYQVTDYLTFRDYFKSLSELNVDVQDFSYGDKDAIENKLKSDIQYPLLHVEPYMAKLNGKDSDSLWLYCTAGFTILEKSTDQAFTEAQTPDGAKAFPVIERDAESIVQQFISKLLEDKRNQIINLDPKSFKYGTIDPIFTDHCRGVRVEFTIILPFVNCTDPAKWVITPKFISIDPAEPNLLVEVNDARSIKKLTACVNGTPIGAPLIVTPGETETTFLVHVGNPLIAGTYTVKATLTDDSIKNSEEDGITYIHP